MTQKTQSLQSSFLVFPTTASPHNQGNLPWELGTTPLLLLPCTLALHKLSSLGLPLQLQNLHNGVNLGL